MTLPDDLYDESLFEIKPTQEYQGQSNCCDAPVYGVESDICSKCGEHCEVIKETFDD